MAKMLLGIHWWSLSIPLSRIGSFLIKIQSGNRSMTQGQSATEDNTRLWVWYRPFATTNWALNHG